MYTYTCSYPYPCPCYINDWGKLVSITNDFGEDYVVQPDIIDAGFNLIELDSIAIRSGDTQPVYYDITPDVIRVVLEATRLGGEGRPSTYSVDVGAEVRISEIFSRGMPADEYL